MTLATRPRIQLDEAFDQTAIAASAHVIGVGSRAEKQLHRVNENRLARARFAGDDIEAGAELELEPVDHGEVLDAQFFQHDPKSKL